MITRTTGRLRQRGSRLCALLLAACCAPAAQAQGQALVQDGIIIDPVLPFDFDQGRNTSLREQVMMENGPLGIRRGTLLILPRVSTGVGASNNPFLAGGDPDGDVFVRVNPSVDVRTDWARHRLNLNASAVLTRYAREDRLNRTEWNLGASGLLNVGDYGTVEAEARVSRVQEEPYTSGLDASTAILSRFRRGFGALRAARQVGRTRFSATAALEDYSYDDLEAGDGTVISQGARNRRDWTGAGQAEYAFSPGAVGYVQGSYVVIDYQLPGTPLAPTRDGQSWRLLAGLNADLPGRLRGTIAAGYTRRSFDDPTYDPVSGFSAQGEVTWFADPLTNVTLLGRRLLQEAPIGGDAFFESSARLSVDRSVRRNLLLGVSGYLGKIEYGRSPVDFRVRQAGASAEYFAPRWYDVRLGLTWTRRNARPATIGVADFDELAALLTLTIHP
ncbi:outer membrane beta-barrel protein [Croceibacterium ferulae]|uniref:outer membrane beta-barrel protein n=1 Tax=Croceibacterium ferulae TaxID=1854641 RepID=UPI000EB3B056|nr:outer membrane beta-barrel protein [Croceibacterium ferulae]